MRSVVFAGVRGEPAALDALLQVVSRQPPSELVCLGGAVPGPDPQGVLERLRRARVVLIAGESERAFLKSDELARLKPAEAAYLRAASAPRRFMLAGRLVVLSSGLQLRGDVVLTPADCGAIADAAEATYLVLDEDASVRKRSFAWTRHV